MFESSSQLYFRKVSKYSLTNNEKIFEQCLEIGVISEFWLTPRALKFGYISSDALFKFS